MNRTTMHVVVTLVVLVKHITTSSSAVAEKPRAAAWVSFGWVVGDGAWVRQYSAPNVVGSRKLKTLIFYTINQLL